MKSKIFISFKNIQVAIKIPKKNNNLNRLTTRSERMVKVEIVQNELKPH